MTPSASCEVEDVDFGVIFGDCRCRRCMLAAWIVHAASGQTLATGGSTADLVIALGAAMGIATATAAVRGRENAALEGVVSAARQWHQRTLERTGRSASDGLAAMAHEGSA